MISIRTKRISAGLLKQYNMGSNYDYRGDGGDDVSKK